MSTMQIELEREMDRIHNPKPAPGKSGPPTTPNEALRELGGRIKRLTYFDMLALSEITGLDPTRLFYAAERLSAALR